ncbi:MAG: nuclear transport factor 2 family protein [Myxococcales bacterium]|nr:MAG: nuclear transport factor 2 family protein [Myxococcales bacterium]
MHRTTKHQTLALRLSLLLLLALPLAACGGSNIPNTTVDDNSKNREVLEFVELYRKAIEARDIAKLLSLASPSYLDDNGTPHGADDIDYEKLQEKLKSWKQSIIDVRYEIRYRNIQHRGDRVYVDYTYTGNFRLKKPDGESSWSRRLADNRLILDRSGDTFTIVSGM